MYGNYKEQEPLKCNDSTIIH